MKFIRIGKKAASVTDYSIRIVVPLTGYVREEDWESIQEAQKLESGWIGIIFFHLYSEPCKNSKSLNLPAFYDDEKNGAGLYQLWTQEIQDEADKECRLLQSELNEMKED